MSCLVCFTDYSEIKNIKLPCNCEACSNCFTSWAIEQINGFAYQVTNSIRCIKGCGGKDFHIDQIIDSLTNSQRELINEALLGAYLKKSQDVRICPAGGCNYAGVIDLDARCSENLECMKCGNQWCDKTQAIPKKKAPRIVRGINKFGEFRSEIWELFFTQACPHCQMKIQKNGGCRHMTCARCRHEFCWECGQDYYGHQQTVCRRIKLTKFLIAAFFTLNILYLLGLLQLIYMVLSFVFSWVFFILGYVLKCGFFTLALKTAYDINGIIRRKSTFEYLRIIFMSFVIYFYGYLFKFIGVLLFSVCMNWLLRQRRGTWRETWNDLSHVFGKVNKYRKSFMKLASYA